MYFLPPSQGQKKNTWWFTLRPINRALVYPSKATQPFYSLTDLFFYSQIIQDPCLGVLRTHRFLLLLFADPVGAQGWGGREEMRRKGLHVERSGAWWSRPREQKRTNSSCSVRGYFPSPTPSKYELWPLPPTLLEEVSSNWGTLERLLPSVSWRLHYPLCSSSCCPRG